MANEEALYIDEEKYKEYELKAKAFDYLIYKLEHNKKYIGNIPQSSPSYYDYYNTYSNVYNISYSSIPTFEFKIQLNGNESLKNVILREVKVKDIIEKK